MNQDAMFFMVTGLIVVVLVMIGPVFVVWQYQHPKTLPPKVNREQDSDI
jgi:hypothetical protein